MSRRTAGNKPRARHEVKPRIPPPGGVSCRARSGDPLAVGVLSRVMAAGRLPDLHFFHDAERALVEHSLELVEAGARGEADLLHTNLDRLAHAADLVRDSPAVLGSWEARRVAGGPDGTLLDLLCAVPDWDLELHVPVRVIFGQAYLIAKINFLKALTYGLDAVDAPEELHDRAEFALGRSIYSKLAEELFISIVTDRQAERRLKVAAAQALIRIWENRLESEIDDFAPVLDSVWHARNKLRPIIGTTLGTQEFFRLLRECSDTRFLDYFDDEVPDEQLQAFEEFLFGLGWEQLNTLRERMQTESAPAVTPEQARKLLGRPPSWAPRDGGPQALYTSYKRRRVRAQYRALTSAPGPRKTAEEFVMRSFLVRDPD